MSSVGLLENLGYDDRLGVFKARCKDCKQLISIRPQHSSEKEPRCSSCMRSEKARQEYRKKVEALIFELWVIPMDDSLLAESEAVTER